MTDTATDITLHLSDDIGKMADRIGEMADRIVKTDELIANSLLKLTGGDETAHGVLARKDMQAMENRLIIRITTVVVTTVAVTGTILGILTVLF